MLNRQWELAVLMLRCNKTILRLTFYRGWWLVQSAKDKMYAPFTLVVFANLRNEKSGGTVINRVEQI